MWGRIGRRRTRRNDAIEQAMGALERIRGRLFGQPSPRRARRAYSDAVELGMGVLAMIVVLSLLFWRFRRTAEETASDSNH